MRTRLEALMLAAALAGCAAAPPAPPAPVVLSYSYRNWAADGFPGHRDLAERVKPGYVLLTIYAKGEGAPSADLAGRIVVVASGTIVDRRGYIVTAAHIAKDTGLGARVRTIDGREHEATILHVDPGRELALLRTEAPLNMPPVRFGDPARLVRGEPALAMGSPDQHAGVVSLGYVRIPRRKTRLDYNGYGFDSGIELKMEVESGHSGGPVFNARGEAIGMVASYLLGDTTKSPYVSPAIAFAVPADAVRAYVAEHAP